MSARGRATLEEWRQALAGAESGPYVGPRPQTSNDGERMLIGRDGDLERINEAVLDHPLVVLDGYSGVGKSSLLQNGLYQRLAMAGFAVLVSRTWGAIPPEPDWVDDAAVDRYVAGRIRKSHQQAAGGLALKPTADGQLPGWQELASGKLCARLDELYHDSGAVLILDQFEELLRQSPPFADRVVRWIINVGYRYRVRVVLSLRTDSLHQLDPLLRGVRPFSIERVNVGEIEGDAVVQKVIETRRDIDGTVQGAAPDRAAVERLLALWQRREHGAKLLDLQAMLYVLHFRALAREAASQEAAARAAPGRGRIGAGDVERLAAAAQQAGIDPFSFGLREAIHLKIAHAEAASRSVGLDEYLVSGTREVVRRAAAFLSSGDFKVPVHEVELAQRTMAREREVLRAGGAAGDPVAGLFAELRAPQAQGGDLLTVGWMDVALAESSATDGSRYRGDVTAGPMMSAPAGAGLLEEVRRVAFAVEWLAEVEIIRKDDDGWLLLVHDRSGSALNAWTAGVAADPDQALRQLTAARGEHYVWDREIGGEAHRVIANLNWRDCRISARFRNVIFVNCDFSGSRFDTCTLQGVTFINCLLDDANFEYCEIRGAVDQQRLQRPRSSAAEKDMTRPAPSFTVAIAAAEVRAFAPYLEGEVAESGQLFSDTSGKPAIPGAPPRGYLGEIVAHFAATGEAQGDTGHRPVQVVAPTRGGVVMVGGRLCFLTLYRCRSEAGGSFAFHHVAGGGLDIVEQYGGRIDLHDAVVRGISITRDADHASAREPRVDLTVNEAIVVNTCFSDGLRGSARFERSRVFMLLNGSENTDGGFRVRLADCRYQFLVNTDPPEGVEDSREVGERERYFAKVPGSDSRCELANRTALARELEAMDFRARPEEREDEQRLRRVPAGARRALD